MNKLQQTPRAPVEGELAAALARFAMDKRVRAHSGAQRPRTSGAAAKPDGRI